MLGSGNIVLYDHTPYKVIKNHVSNDFSLDKDNFEITYSNIRDFNASSYYKAGSYVLYDNNIYKALNDTKGDIGHNQEGEKQVRGHLFPTYALSAWITATKGGQIRDEDRIKEL